MTDRPKFLSYVLLVILVLGSGLQMAVSADGPVLTARESGVGLYARQDPESPRIATLERGEPLTALFEAIGTETWYMVRTKGGATGWVRAADVIASSAAKEVFTEQAIGTSTWSARSSDGQVFEGTWTLAPSSNRREASGGWTLMDKNGATVMRGSWLAEKHETGWNGVWRATVEGRPGERSGSWSAEFPHMRDAAFADLFAAAAKETLRGLWTGGAASGSCSIRYAK